MKHLLESRKFWVLVLACALIGIVLVVAGVVVATGRATFDQFVEVAKWGVGAVGALASAFSIAVGIEDAALFKANPGAGSIRPPPIRAITDPVIPSTPAPPDVTPIDARFTK